jgi:photosystem II stability/assembly factor-like uncharacterized protein
MRNATSMSLKWVRHVQLIKKQFNKLNMCEDQFNCAAQNTGQRFLRMSILIILTGGLILCCSTSGKKAKAEINLNGRNDTWSITGYGGGGAMFNPAVSPHNVNYAYVSCDMSQSFVTYNGGDSWRMFNLRGAVHFYVFDPLDSNVVYANSIALFRSNDKGNTWNMIYPDPSEILGIATKGDEADEYLITKDSTRKNVLAFVVDPDNSKKLYAVLAINEEAGFYFSSDAGANWTKEKVLDDGARNIFVVPSSPKENRTIYITGKNTITAKQNGIWKSNKGPEGVTTLTEFAGGFDQKGNKYIIYATSGKSYFNPAGDKSGIYYTEDGGRTWENRQDGLVRFCTKTAEFPEWRSIATSSLHPEVVYVSYNGLKVHNDTTCIGVAKSKDYGKTWELVWKDRLNKGGDKYSENYNKGWIDERFGPTWGENPFAIGVSPANPEVCYTTDFGRTIKTSNGGKTWEQLYTKKLEGSGWTSRGLDVTTGYSVVFDPFDLNHMFFTNTDVGLMESKDGGKSWMSATQNNGIPRNWQGNTYCLAFDPDVKGKAWAVMSGVHDLPRYKMWRRTGLAGFDGGILVTEDGGMSWQAVSRDIGEAAMTHILIDPSSNKESRTLYACAFGKGVYKSTNGGKTWILKNSGIEGTEPLAWSITRRVQDGALFLIVNRKSETGGIATDQDGALYRSDDGAETWVRMTLPSETNCPTSLLIDPENADNLVLSAWGRSSKTGFSPSIGGGIFISGDAGKTWKPVLQKDQFIHDLTFDPRIKRYYACGFSSSAYWSDDKGKTWVRIKGFNHKLGRRVDIDPRDANKIFITTYGGGVWYGPAKGDDQAVEDINTKVVAY